MKFLNWLKRNVWAVVVGLVAALGAGLFWAYHNGKVRSLEVQGAVEKAHARVAALDAEREALEEAKDENRERIEAIRVESQAIKIEMVANAGAVGKMSNAEIEQAFQDLY